MLLAHCGKPAVVHQSFHVLNQTYNRPIGDVDGPAVAKRVYEEIFGGDSEYIDSESIPYALDAAVGELRHRKLHPSRWASYIHLGI